MHKKHALLVAFHGLNAAAHADLHIWRLSVISKTVIDGDEEKKKDDNVALNDLGMEGRMGKKMQFVHRAKRYELTREDFIRAVKNVPPARVQRYSVTIGKLEYPTRQVVALATGRPSIEFTSAAAYRILQKFGFDIDVWE